MSADAAPSASSPERVTLQLKWRHQFQFAGYYAAIEKGFYRDAGLDVVVKEGQPGMNLAEEVVSGRADYGIDMPELLIERDKGKPVVVLAAIFQHSPEILIAMADSGIQSPQDLVGRRVELRPRGNIEIQAMLLNEGIPLKDIKIVAHSWGIDNLISRKVDASAGYITDRPFLLEKRGISYIVIRPLTYGIDFYGDCLFTSEKEIKEHPERVQAFLKASLRGWAYAMENPDEIIDIILTRYNAGLSRELLRFEAEETRKLMLPKFIEIGHMNPGRWRHIADTFVSLGLLEPDYSLEGFLYVPNPEPDFKWFRLTLGIILSAFFLIAAGSVVLFIFNKKLRQAVQERSSALSKVNNELLVEVAERRRTENVLRESENRYRTLFESANDAIFIMKDDLFIDCNEKTLEIFGCTREQIINQPPYRFSPQRQPDGRDSAEKAKEKIHAAYSGNPQFFEWKHKKCDGTLFDAEVSLNAIELDSGKYLQAIVRDITDRKRTEEELEKHRLHLEELVKERTAVLEKKTFDLEKSQQALRYLIEDVNESRNELEEANKKLQELDRLKSMFIASMSHELRTPLNSIIGFTGITLQGLSGELNDEQRDNLTRAHRAALHLLELITDVIDISKIEAGRIDLFPEEFSLRFLLEETILSVMPQAREKGLTIDLKMDEDIHPVTDKRRLMQCVLNLLSNSVKYTENGGVMIEARICREEDGDVMEISVTDSGIGIAEEDISKLFEPFERLQTHLQLKTGGTGLGLYLTRKIITELLGGAVSVRSEPGKGSTFSLRLPMTMEDTARNKGAT